MTGKQQNAARLAELWAQYELLEDMAAALPYPSSFFTLDRQAAFDEMMARKAHDIAEHEARAIGYQGRIYCKHTHWTVIVKNGIEVHISYTTEADGEGWYWWELRLVRTMKMAGITAGMVEHQEFGKFRKRKDARAKSVKLWREYKAKKTIRIPTEKTESK